MSRRTHPREPKNARHSYRFTQVDDLRQRLGARDEERLIETLTALRNQLTVKHDEGSVSAGDDRLLLVQSWMTAAPAAQDLFEIWERASTRQFTLLSLLLSVFSSVITLLSFHYTYQSTAAPIVKTLLLPQWSSQLNTYLSTAHNELILVTLKLYNALSAFSGGQERKILFEVFPWDMKSLPKLLHMRRRKKEEDDSLVLSRPDIRSLYVLFLLSFVESTTPSSVKADFLEQRRDTFASLFRGLDRDAYPLVRRVLEICWTGLWSDPKIRRTLKIGLFNETTIAQIIKLYERNTPEEPFSNDVVADIAHHFLLAICTHPNVGICFRDRGWYPREEAEGDAQQDGPPPSSSRVPSRLYNKLLANILKTLKVNEDARQQELAYRMLSACPELVAGYWFSAALTLEPRLSSRWIANIAFLGAIVSLPVPRSSFLLPDSELYQPLPPPLNIIIENILPSSNIRNHLSRGLLSNWPLVQHCTAIALVKCLTKYGFVLQAIRAAETALEEDEDGQWSKRRHELELEVARRVPEFQVVVAFSQQKAAELPLGVSSHSTTSTSTSTSLLAESGQRLLWLYHRWLPQVIAEGRFDVGKLLQSLPQGPERLGLPGDGLSKLRQLHVLRLLQESDQFSLLGKVGFRGNFSILLHLHVSADLEATRSIVSAILRQTLSKTMLFQHDVDELDLWLSSLSFYQRSEGAEAPDGTPLTDEAYAVITFLEDCIQRCLKTPYRYLESLQQMWNRRGSSEDLPAGSIQYLPSPLFVTVVEQLEAKHRSDILAPSDTLAIVTFMRKVIWSLMQKIHWLGPLSLTAERLVSTFTTKPLSGAVMQAAVIRELRILSHGIVQVTNPNEGVLSDFNTAVEKFLQQVDTLPIPGSLEKRKLAAYELVDRLRLLAEPMHVDQFNRLLQLADRLYAPASRVLYEYIDPLDPLLWTSVSTAAKPAQAQHSFALLFFHSNDRLLDSEEFKNRLVDSLYSIDRPSAIQIQRALRLINLRMNSSGTQASRFCGLMLLCRSIAARCTVLTGSEQIQVRMAILQLEGLQLSMREQLQSTSREVLRLLMQELYQTNDRDCRYVISRAANYWVSLLKETTVASSEEELHTALMWMKFADELSLSALVEHLYRQDKELRLDSSRTIFHDLLDALAYNCRQLSPSFFSDKLRLLAVFPVSALDEDLFEKLVDITLQSVLPPFYDGLLESRRAYNETIADVFGQSCSFIPSDIGRYLDVRRFLDKTYWTDETASIVAKLVHLNSDARTSIRKWLNSALTLRSVAHLARLTHALLDHPWEDSWTEGVTEALYTIFASFIHELSSAKPLAEDVTIYLACMSRLPRLPYEVAQQAIDRMRKQYESSKNAEFSGEMLDVAHCLSMQITPASSRFLLDLIHSCLEWISLNLSDGEFKTKGTPIAIKLLSLLRTMSGDLNVVLVEPVIVAIVQGHLTDNILGALACQLSLQVILKPVTANRVLQHTIRHPKLRELANAKSPCRDSIVSLLHRFFHMHPHNSCQPNHIEPLLTLYGGTLSHSDRKLLAIFSLFEHTRKSAVTSLLSRWSPSPDRVCDNAVQAIQNLDPIRTWRTCLQYPQFVSYSAEPSNHNEGHFYDPSFLILLFSCLFSERAAIATTSWIQILRTNIACLLIRSLSSHQSSIRKAALVQVAALYDTLQDVDIHERPHLLYLLRLLKDSYVGKSEEHYPERLPAYTTLYLAHALRGILYPSYFTYPHTARFLLQRPELDLDDVPALYTMFISQSDQWRKERIWILRFLADGLVGGLEWKVLRRRHTWDLVASMLTAGEKDVAFRRSVLELLASVTCMAQVTVSLVLGHAFLPWFEMHLREMQIQDSLAWARILENITVAILSSKLKSSRETWYPNLERCMMTLLTHPSCSQDVFVRVMLIMSRLTKSLTVSTGQGVELISASMRHLVKLEVRLKVAELAASARNDCSHSSELAYPPHSLQSLWRTEDIKPYQAWSLSVNSIWRLTMSLNHPCKEWMPLTLRMLFLRATTHKGEAIADWVRNQVVSIIGVYNV